MASTLDRLALRLGAILGFFAVVLGAFAAHGPVHDYLDRRAALDLWHTALAQQWFHALALLAVGQGRTAPRSTIVCWLIGVICFSGSLYLLALAPSQKWAGPITPLGGLFLVAGWGRLWFYLIRPERKS